MKKQVLAALTALILAVGTTMPVRASNPADLIDSGIQTVVEESRRLGFSLSESQKDGIREALDKFDELGVSPGRVIQETKNFILGTAEEELDLEEIHELLKDPDDPEASEDSGDISLSSILEEEKEKAKDAFAEKADEIAEGVERNILDLIKDLISGFVNRF